MATQESTTTTVTAKHEQDTKGGKRRYRVDSNGVSGTLYFEKDTPEAKHKVLTLDIRPASA